MCYLLFLPHILTKLCFSVCLQYINYAGTGFFVNGNGGGLNGGLASSCSSSVSAAYTGYKFGQMIPGFATFKVTGTSVAMSYIDWNGNTIYSTTLTNPKAKAGGLTRRPTGKPTVKPAFRPTRKPTVKPTGKPVVKPTGKPVFMPTGKPVVKPTGKPGAMKPTGMLAAVKTTDTTKQN